MYSFSRAVGVCLYSVPPPATRFPVKPEYRLRPPVFDFYFESLGAPRAVRKMKNENLVKRFWAMNQASWET